MYHKLICFYLLKDTITPSRWDAVSRSRRLSPDVGPLPGFGRTCVSRVMTNNTVVVVFRVYAYYIHTAATVMWNYSCVAEMAPGQNVRTSRAHLQFAAEFRALPCTDYNNAPRCQSNAAARKLTIQPLRSHGPY